MSGVRGQNKANGSALKHGGKSLLALVERAQDPRHPVLQIVMQKTQAYTTDKGGVDALSTMEQDTLKHGAVLDILADMTLHRILNERGVARRMSAGKLMDLCLGYSRLAEAHSRLLSAVGLARYARPVDPATELTAYFKSLPANGKEPR